MGIEELLGDKREELIRLCLRYRVQCLEVFGSAAGDRFDARTSDLDFLVEFLTIPAGENAEMYFGLLEGLEGLFGRPVDLVMVRAARNPYFLEGIAASRRVLYAA